MVGSAINQSQESDSRNMHRASNFASTSRRRRRRRTALAHKDSSRNTQMHPLDNPIWNALGTKQSHFAENYGILRRFPPEVTPLGGFPEANEEGFAAVRGLLAP